MKSLVMKTTFQSLQVSFHSVGADAVCRGLASFLCCEKQHWQKYRKGLVPFSSVPLDVIIHTLWQPLVKPVLYHKVKPLHRKIKHNCSVRLSKLKIPDVHQWSLIVKQLLTWQKVLREPWTHWQAKAQDHGKWKLLKKMNVQVLGTDWGKTLVLVSAVLICTYTFHEAYFSFMTF